MTQPDSTTNTGAVEALKPCPFCGGTPHWCDDEHGPTRWIECNRCGVSTLPDDRDHYPALQIWNTRATPTPASEAEVIERCARVVEEYAPYIPRPSRSGAAAAIRALSSAKERQDD